MEDKNKLKVILTNKDLKNLNITYNDFNYNTPDTKKIILEILTQAKAITGFDYYGKMLLIEVFPYTKKGCLMYFSLVKEKRNSILGKYSFEYSNIENLINSTIPLFEMYGHRIFKSSLYTDKKSRKYFLTVSTINFEDKEITYLLNEFGNQKPRGSTFQAFIDEHYSVVIKGNAIEILYNTFK